MGPSGQNVDDFRARDPSVDDQVMYYHAATGGTLLAMGDDRRSRAWPSMRRSAMFADSELMQHCYGACELGAPVDRLSDRVILFYNELCRFVPAP